MNRFVADVDILELSTHCSLDSVAIINEADIRCLAELSETFDYNLFSMLHLSAILTDRSRYYIALLFAFLMMLFLSVLVSYMLF